MKRTLNSYFFLPGRSLFIKVLIWHLKFLWSGNISQVLCVASKIPFSVSIQRWYKKSMALFLHQLRPTVPHHFGNIQILFWQFGTHSYMKRDENKPKTFPVLLVLRSISESWEEPRRTEGRGGGGPRDCCKPLNDRLLKSLRTEVITSSWETHAAGFSLRLVKITIQVGPALFEYT